MSLFAVWLFVRIYCPMSCSISLSDICRNFFTAFSLVFCPIFCPNLWDALFDFFVRPSCPILCPIFCLIFLLDILSHVLFDFVSGYFVRIYMSDFWLVFPSDFLAQFIVRCLHVRSLCLIFCPTISFDFCPTFVFDLFCPIFCFILCPIFCSFCFSDVSAFDMPMIFHSHASKAHFHKKVWILWPHFESEGFWNSEVAYWLKLFNHIQLIPTNWSENREIYSLFQGFKGRYHAPGAKLLRVHQRFDGYTSSSGAGFPPRKILHDI